MSDADVATDVGCNRTTVFRARKRFEDDGRLQRRESGTNATDKDV